MVQVKEQCHHTDILIHIHAVSSELKNTHTTDYRNENYKCMRFLNTATYRLDPPSLLSPPCLILRSLVFSFCVNLAHFLNLPPPVFFLFFLSNCPSHSAAQCVSNVADSFLSYLMCKTFIAPFLHVSHLQQKAYSLAVCNMKIYTSLFVPFVFKVKASG